jgi:hypothetical protein
MKRPCKDRTNDRVEHIPLKRVARMAIGARPFCEMLTVSVNRKPRRAWPKAISYGWGDPVPTVGQIDEDTRRRHSAKQVERPSGRVRSGQVRSGQVRSGQIRSGSGPMQSWSCLCNYIACSQCRGGLVAVRSTEVKEISTERCLVFAREEPALGGRVVQ